MKLNRSSLIVSFALFLIAAFVGFNLYQNNRPIQVTAGEGDIIAWGRNTSGQLGRGTSTANEPNSAPVGLPQSPLQIAMGQNHSLALYADGTVWSWGSNRFGQTADQGIGTTKETPSIVKGLPPIAEIAANHQHSLALDRTGNIWAFGYNYSGQLGDDTNINHDTPIQIEGIKHVSKIAAGYRFSVALKDDGSVWAWGVDCKAHYSSSFQQTLEQVATNITNTESYWDPYSDDGEDIPEESYCYREEVVGVHSRTPQQIAGIEDVADISAGYGHILFLKKDGSVWSMGCNTYGQLGNGSIGPTPTNRTPTQIESLHSIVRVIAGFRHSLALDAEGTLWVWGHNEHGQLGNGTTETSSLPVTVEGIGRVTQIAAGHDYTLALSDDNQLWGWGENQFMQLGENERVVLKPSHLPINVGQIKSLYAGGGHVVVVQTK